MTFRKLITILICFSLITLVLSANTWAQAKVSQEADWLSFFSRPERGKTPVDYVNPYIGAISHTLQPTRPTVHLPNSMVRLLPLNSPGVPDVYVASKIYGFALNVPAHRGEAVTTVMATRGDLTIAADAVASAFDHDFELATPYCYSVLLEDDSILARVTPGERSAFYQFKALAPGMLNLLVRLRGDGQVNFVNAATLTGFETYHGVRQYFYLELTPAGAEHGTWIKDTVHAGSNQASGVDIGAYWRFNLTDSATIRIRTGISWLSSEQAGKNLAAELPHWDFGRQVLQARQRWNQLLGKIIITGGAEPQLTTFYTALYRCFERMVNISEDGRYFSAYDRQVHSDTRPFYVDDWLWDSFRSLHPLRLLLIPAAEQDMLQSYVRMYEHSGWLPTFPQIYGDAGCMIGHHQAALFADAYAKGLRSFDIKTAYEGLKKNATQGTMIPWREGPATELDQFYRQHGFFPALAPDQPETVEQVHSFEKRQAVAVTLEHAYDDWCLAHLAQSFGYTDDAELFNRRGQNYRTLFNPATGFMAPKDARGDWIEPFDPSLSGGVGSRAYFAEVNSWTFTWFVPHDIPGLMQLMGGRDHFVRRLDQLFEQPLGTAKWVFLGQFPDATGLVGQFVMGNEPSFHIPYLYNHVGAPWKAQKRLRQLMDAWFRPDVMGICGDEDGGALSAWYVFAALGFFPICPGHPSYDFGSPTFPKVTLCMENGKDLVIRAEKVSAQNKYIQAVTIDGQPWNKPWFSHQQIQNGAEIIIRMGPRPNPDWGTAR